MLKRPRIGVTDVERINKVSSGGRVSMGFYGFLRSLAGRPLAADMHPMYRHPIRLEDRIRTVDLSCFPGWDDLLTEDVAEKKLTPRDGRFRHVMVPVSHCLAAWGNKHIHNSMINVDDDVMNIIMDIEDIIYSILIVGGDETNVAPNWGWSVQDIFLDNN
ncbi:hypothetical protein ASPVEDRAFT_508311 [Aspergillus versicolor CBS 583.65]|uniref:Uncharacterized protein n=1 Tax=Aspergillus versicolor CBS 583.65 TaxID=1036611 RepID=A0A1L9PCY2_ASPVE|nr:uncharacterized protein ASPVEDRAFT_508311 [Aspergillus versicolor CBS 583.65]OJI99314.1 hypothetical protein ASPVEDRAFT_508311 [Aspergillus versicolor CBS 583.65]